VKYRSPNSSKQNTEKLCDIINCLSGEKNIIIGDFNFPMFNNNCCNSNQEVSDWSKANYPALEQYLKDIDWSSTFSSLNTQQCWNFFKKTISQGVELFVPKIRRRDKNKPTWMT